MKCKSIKLTHLYFVDDFLLLCNGYFRSIYTLYKALMFSNASSLEVNTHTSEVYYAGIQEGEVQRVADVSGFKIGRTAINYLGVPITTS